MSLVALSLKAWTVEHHRERSAAPVRTCSIDRKYGRVA